MKTNLFAFVSGLILAVSVASVASASEKAATQAGRDLQVTVIDTHDDKVVRETVQAALSSSLTSSFERQFKKGTKVVVKSEGNASRAAKDLRKGSCDAVIVISSSVPEVFFKEDYVILKADSVTKDLNRTFYLVGHSTRDAALNKLVAQVFDQAVRSANLQEAVARKPAPKSDLAAVAP
jgi:hypothetical protein